MANIIIGTAGHIDHGKTTLIKALTGISTDTTEEEVERGMSINLGFAYFDLPSGKKVGIIDVPGHERFIKNMLAGASGINMILLVIDANEGVMPQTLEHANILNLLGVENFIGVLTKADMVEDEYLDLLEEDIREKFAGTPIETAPIVRVDSLSGRGLKELIKEIDEVAGNVKQMNLTADPRLNVDRVFTVKGFGTVITGTLIEGTIAVDDDLMVYTGRLPVKVRNIQVHEKNVAGATAGQRTALNLQGVKVTDIKRGDVLTKPDTLTNSYITDARIRVLPNFEKPLKLWDRVRVYIGTREVMARVVPLGVESILPGEEGFVQIRFEEEIVSKPGDRIILRAYSPMVTLGGGSILDPKSVKHGRFDESILKGLEIKEKNDTESVITDFLMNSDNALPNLKEIAEKVTAEDLSGTLEAMIKAGEVFRFNDGYMKSERFMEITEEIKRHVRDYHKKFPLKTGIPKEEIKSKMKYVLKAKDYDPVFEMITGKDFLINEGSRVRLPEFQVVYTKDQQKIYDEIISAVSQNPYAPPSIKELTKGKGAMEVLESMLDTKLIRIDADTVFAKEAFKEAYRILKDEVGAKGPFTLADYRDRLDTSRKYAVALLDFFDKLGITIRKEDARVLTGKEL